MSENPNSQDLEGRLSNAVNTLAQEDAARAERGHARQRPGRALGGVVVLVVSLVALAASVAWGWNKWNYPAGRIADAVIAEGLRFELDLAAASIDSFRKNTGQLPVSLDDAYRDGSHIRYRVTGSSYELETDGPDGPIRLSAGATQQ